MSDPDDYPRAVIRKALEDADVSGDLGAATDLTYRMLLAGSMLQSAYWPRGYMKNLMEQAGKPTDHRSDADERCGEPCDHCRPDILHDCTLPNGHRGFHSCEAS